MSKPENSSNELYCPFTGTNRGNRTRAAQRWIEGKRAAIPWNWPEIQFLTPLMPDSQSLQTLIQDWDGENVIIRFDRPARSWIFVAVHSTRLGPATGGTRMRPYPSLDAALADALKLAEGMTYKYAVPGMPRGGGKAVICTPPDLAPDNRSGLLHRYGRLLRNLGGYFQTGPDVGTSPEDMDTIAETGAPHVFCRTPAAGGAGSSGPLTALGVFTAIQVACEHAFGSPSLEGRRVLVQGMGSVGEVLVRYLRGAGGRVAFSEVDEGLARRFGGDPGLEFVPTERVYTHPCDVYSPCALGGVLNEDTVPRLDCRIIAGGANNQLASPEATEALQSRGILYLPDYVVNVGGAMGITGMEAMGWTQAEAEREVVTKVRTALQRILELTASDNISTEAAARRIAEKHLSSGVG
jgi:leucine dehydrogenase